MKLSVVKVIHSCTVAESLSWGCKISLPFLKILSTKFSSLNPLLTYLSPAAYLNVSKSLLKSYNHDYFCTKSNIKSKISNSIKVKVTLSFNR